MKPEHLKVAIGYDDADLGIELLSNFADVDSRRNLDTSTNLSRNLKISFPLLASPMDTVSGKEMCVTLNSVGGAAILHRFMPDDERLKVASEIKEACGTCYVAVSLSDSQDMLRDFFNVGVNLFFLDVAHGSQRRVFEFIKFVKKQFHNFQSPPDLITGNTITKESVTRSCNLGADGCRHGIGGGSACLTSLQTGIGCPAITSIYYGWKGIRNWSLNNNDLDLPNERPSLLVDGGIRNPSDLVKAICAGADGAISGRMFAGCRETPGEVVKVDGKLCKVYRGMASKEVQVDNEIGDGSSKDTFIEGDSYLVPYRDVSAVDIVHDFANGVRSAMSYLNYNSVEQMRGSLWSGDTKAVLVTPSSGYEQEAHGK